MALPHSLMLTLAPTFACRRAPSRLIHDCHYTAIRPRAFSSSTPQTLSTTTEPPAPDSGPFSLAGTAPDHTAYVLLHTHLPPAAYPARSRSPLWRAWTMKARRWGGAVNFAWAPGGQLPAHPAYAGLGEDPDDRRLQRERYTASVFSVARRHARLEIPEVSLANLDEVDEALRKLVHGDGGGYGYGDSSGSGGGKLAEAQEEEGGWRLDARLHLYVCTHGSRDCRCGEGGGEVARALRRELEKRGIGADDVVVGEVAHVGGHKYAANVLVYPFGDWLGGIQDFDVPHVLDDILAWHASNRQATSDGSTTGPSARDVAPLCAPFWRGRMGLDKDEQLALFARAP
ncbi:Sucrase/ferredoxin-like-domain-containing protein [Trametes meyenii]|nr:Sucrase/ferredoxin-like-domain-containing protein [Trametes meyenii]